MREAHGHIPQKGCELHLGRVEITHSSGNVPVLCGIVILSTTVHGTWLFPLSRYIKEREISYFLASVGLCVATIYFMCTWEIKQKG